MHAVTAGLLAGEPVSEAAWSSFWDALASRASAPDAVAVLETLRDRAPDPRSVAALIASLDARRAHPAPCGAVNIVGSGGGPATLNLSTAAAIVAAAIGVRVIKTGSRAFSSRHGSLDLLRLAGIPLARSHAEIEAALERCGIAFAGPFVYPGELTLLARRVHGHDWRTLGAFVNRIGPFLPAVGADAQLTGVSDPALLALYEGLPARRRVWLASNALGVDELVSFADNELRGDGLSWTVPARSAGALEDLRGAEDVVAQLGSLLAGHGPRAALESIALNAAALAALAGGSWETAFAAAREALCSGAATAVLDELRACPASSSS